jgi:hypothetical protein
MAILFIFLYICIQFGLNSHSVITGWQIPGIDGMLTGGNSLINNAFSAKSGVRLWHSWQRNGLFIFLP